MTHKNKLFLFSLVFLQTACTQNSVRPIPLKKPLPPRISSSHVTHPESVTYTNEPMVVEEIPVPQQAVTPPINRVIENKPRPVQSAAVQSLMANAEKNTKAGDLDSASATLERALRISPRNPELTYQLAVLRIKQSQPRLAEDLGKKAAFLAADDRELKKRCWLLIVEARQLQGNEQGAREAQLKAESLE